MVTRFPYQRLIAWVGIANVCTKPEFQISPWCPFEAIAGLKYCQKCVFDAEKDYHIIDDVRFLAEVGNIFNCNVISFQKYHLV